MSKRNNPTYNEDYNEESQEEYTGRDFSKLKAIIGAGAALAAVGAMSLHAHKVDEGMDKFSPEGMEAGDTLHLPEGTVFRYEPKPPETYQEGMDSYVVTEKDGLDVEGKIVVITNQYGTWYKFSTNSKIGEDGLEGIKECNPDEDTDTGDSYAYAGNCNFFVPTENAKVK